MSANASEDICPSLAAAATIILDVRSTQVTIHVCPLLVAGSGPIKSKAQLVMVEVGWMRKILPPYAIDSNFWMQRTPYKSVRNVPRRQTNLASNMHRKPLHTSDQYQDVPPGRCLHEPHTRLLRDLYLVRRRKHSHPLVVILIKIAFITGNSSLEPLLEGLCAQIHVNLSCRVFGRNRTGALRITKKKNSQVPRSPPLSYGDG